HDADVVGRTARHLLRELADRDERAGPGVHGGGGRLVDDEPGALDVDPGAGRTEVDGEVAAAQLLQTGGHGRSSRVRTSWSAGRRTTDLIVRRRGDARLSGRAGRGAAERGRNAGGAASLGRGDGAADRFLPDVRPAGRPGGRGRR